MASSYEPPHFEDDLSRQRRKREARLLDQPVAGFVGLTVADIVAEVLAVTDEGRVTFNVPAYLAEQGHDWQTIEAVVGYLHRQGFYPTAAAADGADVTDISRLN